MRKNNGERKTFSKWMYWFSLVVSLIIVYKVLDSFSSISLWFSRLFSILTPFIIGIIIAYILYMPARNFEGMYKKCKFIKRWARGLSVFTVYMIFALVLVIAFRFLIPAVISSFYDLINNLQSYYNNIKDAVMQLPEDSILKSESVVNAINNLSDFHIDEYINLDMISHYAQGVISFASSIFDIFVSLVVSVYLLLERKEIVEFFRRLIDANFSKETYNNVRKYFGRTNEIFCKFLASQFLDAIVVSILASVAMSIMGVKYAILLGIFIGLFNMIPYFGAIVAVIISALITFITGGFSQAIWMIVIVTILQQIDANIINPKIVGDSLKISPLLVIFAVTVGGAYFNILGMFLAVPIVAVLKVLIGDFIEFKNSQKHIAIKN